ncbi:HesA/MoeB/ThiF family protein [Acaryochloris marina]|uniref:ThiF family protein, putative n=1 Tax=Acaryochloris marina (strain MBIC 11017) TaxID=329726 RepID=A8ZN02_ACAM1|nr:ThiF family adenylyltransferase [Acaryochloris marina]ABW32201.1 ThiF family protein, putative [Acaryochloris marina MBIC11017]
MELPLIYIFNDEISEIFNKLKNSKSDCLNLFSYCLDEGEVYHIYSDLPKIHFSGTPKRAVARIFDDISDKEKCIKFAKKTYRDTDINDHDDSRIIILFANEQAFRVFIVIEAEIFEGIIKIVPGISEIYSRSKGLLETSILNASNVGLIGLGSGGSSVAIELAKAGVGKFILVDFDRLELSNISRHICGINDLGRFKTKAIKDLLLAKNPYIEVETYEVDINTDLSKVSKELKQCNLIIGATDNNRSRFNINQFALDHSITTIFGRAITRAVGGDVLRVRPRLGPCLACVFTKEFANSFPDEVSHFKQARNEMPDYVSDDRVEATIQVGLSSDIQPISNMIVKLALLELSKNKESGLTSLEKDLIADFYIWANRRELAYSNYQIMEYGSQKPSILRWYGAKIERNPYCPVCAEIEESDLSDDNIFK